MPTDNHRLAPPQENLLAVAHHRPGSTQRLAQKELTLSSIPTHNHWHTLATVPRISKILGSFYLLLCHQTPRNPSDSESLAGHRLATWPLGTHQAIHKRVFSDPRISPHASQNPRYLLLDPVYRVHRHFLLHARLHSCARALRVTLTRSIVATFPPTANTATRRHSVNRLTLRHWEHR